MSLVVSLLLARPGGDSGGAEAPPLRVRAHEAALEHACRRRHGPTPGAVRRVGQTFGESQPSIFTEHHRIDPLSCNEPREGDSYDPARAAARGAHMPCSPAAAEAHPARATFAPSASFARLASPSCCGGGGWLGRRENPPRCEREPGEGEETKRKAKAAACDAKNCDFMTWAASTRGGIGHEAATWFNTNFDIKAAKASSDSERWRVSSERKRFLQVHSAIVARRNAAIFDYNAWPKMGGEMPRAPREQYE
ncbi:hypothetical protein EMIHUDRAFT_101799 [Emiliania huxleyi CCMP1516]|uniref:Uncharacterized protein n=2 Tax=Emiliania huxleyi TaxID=2903 RepID=A0A0D3JA98_EMIH1|nr:hypothetical protein EMIHUDRAFT_101799 [Emiliania huxleyi CCMP1516]EOD20433.1 hypothetical protein EMIHUDRAFT_101799 [Emiliania huxleyi CCMP1516]|eukprot:XP_005772862.1 hypothetical protein EMIHUDRAFT_101799 [Emiliania huxleyi CCMP1516]